MNNHEKSKSDGKLKVFNYLIMVSFLRNQREKNILVKICPRHRKHTEWRRKYKAKTKSKLRRNCWNKYIAVEKSYHKFIKLHEIDKNFTLMLIEMKSSIRNTLIRFLIGFLQKIVIKTTKSYSGLNRCSFL